MPDPIAVLASLGFDGPCSVEPVRGGMTTAIWRVDHEEQTYALRVFPPALAQRFQHELAAMERAHRGGILVPVVRASGMYQEHAVMLLDWCAGRTLAAALEAQPWRAWYWGVQFGQMQAAIHRLDFQDDQDWIGWAGTDEQSIQARLRTLEPRHHLIHLDYHVQNVLVDERRITGVIDWTNAHSGDPRADVARTYTILCVEPLKPSPMSPIIKMILWIFMLGWRHGYQHILPGTGEQALFYAWAGAVMVRDLGPRVERPDSWWQARHLHSIQRWTAKRKHRALRASDS